MKARREKRKRERKRKKERKKREEKGRWPENTYDMIWYEVVEPTG
jgi:hypothetical protein